MKLKEELKELEKYLKWKADGAKGQLGDFKQLDLDKFKKEVTDEQFDEVLEGLQYMLALGQEEGYKVSCGMLGAIIERHSK